MVRSSDRVATKGTDYTHTILAEIVSTKEETGVVSEAVFVGSPSVTVLVPKTEGTVFVAILHVLIPETTTVELVDHDVSFGDEDSLPSGVEPTHTRSIKGMVSLGVSDSVGGQTLFKLAFTVTTIG